MPAEIVSGRERTADVEGILKLVLEKVVELTRRKATDPNLAIPTAGDLHGDPALRACFVAPLVEHHGPGSLPNMQLSSSRPFFDSNS